MTAVTFPDVRLILRSNSLKVGVAPVRIEEYDTAWTVGFVEHPRAGYRSRRDNHLDLSVHL